MYKEQSDSIKYGCLPRNSLQTRVFFKCMRLSRIYFSPFRPLKATDVSELLY